MFLSAEKRTVQKRLKKRDISFSFVPDFRGKSIDSLISNFFTVSWWSEMKVGALLRGGRRDGGSGGSLCVGMDGCVFGGYFAGGLEGIIFSVGLGSVGMVDVGEAWRVGGR